MLTRRELIVRGLGVAGLAALGCGDDLTGRDLAVAVLEPTTDAVIVAVWARDANVASIELDDDGAIHELALELTGAGTGALDIGGLAPGRTYLVTVIAGGRRAGPYRVVTAPAADDPRPQRFAVVADLDPSPQFANDLVDHLVAAAPDLVIGLGDLPYCDNGPDVAKTPEAYRAIHAEARAHERFRPLFQAAPLRAIYDDHEFRNDWDAAFAAAEPERYRAALEIWDEFFPVRGAAGEVRYRSWRWGAHVECFLLDCRRFRSANRDPDGPSKTMLGAAQLAWLLDAVTASTATFKLVFTSVPLDYSTGGDAWSTFASERQRVLDGLADTPGVVFVSADQHWFAAHVHAHGLREFQFGPLARDTRTPDPPGPGVLARVVDYNFGLIEVDGDALAISAIGPGGETLFSTTITAASQAR